MSAISGPRRIYYIYGRPKEKPLQCSNPGPTGIYTHLFRESYERVHDALDQVFGGDHLLLRVSPGCAAASRGRGCARAPVLTMPPFPSMNAKQLLAVLMHQPLGYRVVRQRGSHRILDAPGRRRLIYAFHDRKPSPVASYARYSSTR